MVKNIVFDKYGDIMFPHEVVRMLADGDPAAYAWRVYLDISEVDAAKTAGLSVENYRRLEYNSRFCFKDAKVIAHALGIPAEALED